MIKLDLHGYTIHNAWKEFTRHVNECYYNEIKETEIITGHGAIAEEIIAWVHSNVNCKTIIRNPKNTGAFLIKIKKKKLSHKVTIGEVKKPTLDLSKLIKKFNDH
jgi:DNA-nicking Smr family endonuclease